MIGMSHPTNPLGADTRSTDDVLAAVGPRLRALRTRRGVTLAELG